MYTYSLPCGLAHPGLCATTHNAFLPAAKLATKALQRFLQPVGGGSGLRLSATTSDGSVISEGHFQLAHYRGGKPKMSMLAAASLCTESGLLTLDDQSDRLIERLSEDVTD